MAENDKHRARIFLHRGDLVQARAAWEAAVKDDRLTGTQRELSNSLGNLGNTRDRFCSGYKEYPETRAMLRQAASIPHVRGIELVGTWDVTP